MTPNVKDELFAAAFAMASLFAALIMVLFFSGCATRQAPLETPENTHIETAINDADRIDGKAVVIRRWLSEQ